MDASASVAELNSQDTRMPQDQLATVRAQLAPLGHLRAAINYGNTVLAQRSESGTLAGITIDIANDIGRRLRVPVRLAGYPAAGKVVEAAERGEWDIGFLAIDPLRANSILFTRPYVLIEGNYVVQASSRFTSMASVDSVGTRIAVGKGAAYDLYLTREIKNATLVRYPTSAAALDGFLADSLEAAAGVRQPVAAYAAARSGLRLIDEPFMEIRQAVSLPKGHEAAFAFVAELLEELKTSGFLAASLSRAGQDPNLVA